MSESKLINLKILYFAKVKELIQKSQENVLLDVSSQNITSENIFNLIKEKNKKFEEQLENILKTCLLAVNDEYLEKSEVIKLENNDIISIIPPISSG